LQPGDFGDVCQAGPQVPRLVERAGEHGRELGGGGFLRLDYGLVVGGGALHFDFRLDDFELGDVSCFEALLDDVANASGEIKRGLGLADLFLGGQSLVEGLARAAAKLARQNGDVDFAALLFLTRDGEALAALAADFEGLVPEHTLVRRIAGNAEADGGIGNLSGDFQTGEGDGPLLAGGAQLEVIGFGDLQRLGKIQCRALPPGGGRSSAEQDETRESHRWP
jgi:hypothetical protein